MSLKIKVMNILKFIFAGFLLSGTINFDTVAQMQSGQRQFLYENWQMKSSVLLKEDGSRISTIEYVPKEWFKTNVPSTVLSVLVKNGIYPDPRFGLDVFKIPDSSDEFNSKNDLSKYSYLPDKRNPWKDPYWYRTDFNVDEIKSGQHLWLNFNCINYRAEVWINGSRIADKITMAGMFQRFRFDITSKVRSGSNALAVLIFPVDHPGIPDAQLDVFGKSRGEHKEIEFDVTMIETVGYDCMMTVPDRNMGICQEVFLERTGPVDIRNPFVTTELPLPDTTSATLSVSAEMLNADASPVKGLLRGIVAGTDLKFEQVVELAPNEKRTIVFDQKPVLQQPRLWWPVHHGKQNMYEMKLQFEVAGKPELNTAQTIKFGVRQVTSEMHEIEGWHGRRIMINGRKIFCRGGYIQPELLLDLGRWRIEEEIRYFADANMNLIYFEDIPNPPDSFMEACDKYGILFGNCFYACSWMDRPGRPQDLDLLETCTIDLVKRYRNHPSLIMYMSMDEGFARPEVYNMWRKHVSGLDGSRFWIPSGYVADFIRGQSTKVTEKYSQFWPDLPSGMNDWHDDYAIKSYQWQEPVTYFKWVREKRDWMFKIESGSASLPPISSLAKFLPDLGQKSDKGAPFPLTDDWAHHGSNHYYKPYDQAIRRLHGEPQSVADYCWKAHLVTADQHRSFYEAVNHRMWDITSGFTEWKINSCFPDVQWQNFDYFHKPGISHFIIKRSCEPLHVQMDLIDYGVSIINCLPQTFNGLEVEATVYDINSRQVWKKDAKIDVNANTYKDAFIIPGLTSLSKFVFVKLKLKDSAGRQISDNFYWIRGNGTEDYKILQDLPMVKLNATKQVEDAGNEKVVHVKISNPSDHVAFFVQLALTNGKGGEEILPVLWSDNYFSLAPGEIREFTARMAKKDIGNGQPELEVGGWNIQTDYKCNAVKPSKLNVKAGENITVAAVIGNTFIDGSKVTLLLDGKPAATAWTWSRGDKNDQISFEVNMPAPGKHKITIADRSARIVVD
jgi:exo-1,4-beta-D-glucosaminidase